jgi:hypothetical protein
MEWQEVGASSTGARLACRRFGRQPTTNEIAWIADGRFRHPVNDACPLAPPADDTVGDEAVQLLRDAREGDAGELGQRPDPRFAVLVKGAKNSGTPGNSSLTRTQSGFCTTSYSPTEPTICSPSLRGWPETMR